MSSSGVICVSSNIVVTKIFSFGFSDGFVSVSQPLTHLKCNSPTARNLFCHFPLCVKQNCAQFLKHKPGLGNEEKEVVSSHRPQVVTGHNHRAKQNTGLARVWQEPAIARIYYSRSEIMLKTEVETGGDSDQAAAWPSGPWSLVLG